MADPLVIPRCGAAKRSVCSIAAKAATASCHLLPVTVNVLPMKSSAAAGLRTRIYRNVTLPLETIGEWSN